MDFLKSIFGDKALTYAELETALKDSKDIKLANLASGGYVDKGKYDADEARLSQIQKNTPEQVSLFRGERLMYFAISQALRST